MMNQRSEITTAMENLRTDLYQDTIVFENRAIRELGTGVLTPDLTNLIITIFSNKVALILIDCAKQGIRLDNNQIINTLLTSNQSPVMLNIIQQNQLMGTVINNGNIMFSQLLQKAESIAKQNIQKMQERNYMQQGFGNTYGNNMYVQQQPINPYANTLGSGILQPTQPVYNGDNLMNTTRPSARYSNKSTTTNMPNEFASFFNDTPATTPATNKFSRANTPVAPTIDTNAVAPVTTAPVVKNVNWLCAPGVSIDQNQEAIGEDLFKAGFSLHGEKIEGTYKLTDLISLALIGHEAMRKNTVCKVDVEENIKKFYTVGEINEDLFIRHWTLKSNLAMSSIINLEVDNIVNDIGDAKSIISEHVPVIKTREMTYTILNDIVNVAKEDLSFITTKHSVNGSGLEEDTLKTVRECYVVHSPELYDNIKEHELNVGSIVKLSKYSHKKLHNLITDLTNNEEFQFVNLYVVSSKGIIEVMFYTADKHNDVRMILMKQKSI